MSSSECRKLNHNDRVTFGVFTIFLKLWKMTRWTKWITKGGEQKKTGNLNWEEIRDGLFSRNLWKIRNEIKENLETNVRFCCYSRSRKSINVWKSQKSKMKWMSQGVLFQERIKILEADKARRKKNRKLRRNRIIIIKIIRKRRNLFTNVKISSNSKYSCLNKLKIICDEQEKYLLRKFF